MSAVATVAINVDARDATGQLRQVQSQSQATERAVEQLQAGVTGVNTALSRSGRELQTAANGMRFFVDATGRARKENGQFVTTAEAAAAGIKHEGIEAERAAKKLDIAGAASRSLASALATIGVGVGLSKVLSDVKELDTNLRRLATVGGDVAQLDKALGDLSERLGGVASKAELAAASYQAASAGFSDTAGNVRILEAATKAAVGGLASAEGVTEVLVKTLNAYGMAGTDAYKVTDSISKAVEVGNQEWSDYVSQLGRVASISALAGVSLDEVNAFIASATKNGATAEIAFTGLGAALNTLLQPTKESQEAAKALGIEWNLQGLSAKGFTGLMTELAKKQDTNKESVARLLGSQEAMRGVFAANAKQGKDFANILGQLGDATGKTDSDFQTMKVSLENQLKALDTAFKNLSEALGKAFGASVVDSIKGVTGAINGFADIINAIPKPVATATAELVKLLAQMLILEKAIKGVIALSASYKLAMTAIATDSSVATGAVTGLHAALLRLAGLGIITVGVNYAVTQSGQIFGSSSAAGASEAVSTAAALQGKYGKMSAGDRAAQLKAIKANLANDQKLAARLEQQIRLQESAAMSSMDMPSPADRSKLTEIQARIRANQAKAKFLQNAPITAAQAGVKIGQTVGSTVPAAAAAGAGKAGGGAGGGAELPAYISKDQLRQWLISQGFGRTTGDFTNRGHATPNHMLNAMDMGILGGSDAEALRRTSAMERRLRATGAFGDQLFGPLSDPRGHGAGKGGRNIHLHIPTPGGMVKMNPALAALMGIKGAGQGGQFALAQGMADEEAKRLQLIEDSFRTGQQIEQQQNRQLANLQAQTPLERSLLKIQQDYEDRAASISQLLDANQKKKLEGQSAALRELEIIKAQTDNLYRQAGLQKDITSEIGARAFAGAAGTFRTDINLDPLATTDPITEYSQRLKDLMDPINQAKAGAESIGAAFNDAFSGILTGTQTTQEALSNFFKSIADSFLQMASQMIAEMIKVYVFKQITGIFGISGGSGGLFSGAGPVSGASVFSSGQAAFNPAAFGAGVALRAMGGPVTAGQSYVVGERGPELFTPSSGGMITPNNRAGGGGVAVTVNVDAKGTSAEGSDQQANQLGRVIAAAVRAELIKQQRRGGILNS